MNYILKITINEYEETSLHLFHNRESAVNYVMEQLDRKFGEHDESAKEMLDEADAYESQDGVMYEIESIEFED